jgi:hypothetical protein
MNSCLHDVEQMSRGFGIQVCFALYLADLGGNMLKYHCYRISLQRHGRGSWLGFPMFAHDTFHVFSSYNRPPTDRVWHMLVATMYVLLPHCKGIFVFFGHECKRHLGIALFASILEKAGNEIRVKSSSLALHLSDIWPDCSDESLLPSTQQHC